MEMNRTHVTADTAKLNDLLRVPYAERGSQLARVVGFGRRRYTHRRCLRVRVWRVNSQSWTKEQLWGGLESERAGVSFRYELAPRSYVQKKHPRLLTQPKWQDWNPTPINPQ